MSKNLGSSQKFQGSEALTTPKGNAVNRRNADFSKSNIYENNSAVNLNMLAANGDFGTIGYNNQTVANVDDLNMQEDRKNFQYVHGGDYLTRVNWPQNDLKWANAPTPIQQGCPRVMCDLKIENMKNFDLEKG